VCARGDPDLDRDRADLPLATAVRTALLLGDPLTDDALLEPVERELRVLAVLGVGLGLRVAGVLLEDRGLDGLRGVLAGELVLDRRRLVQLRAVRLGDLADEFLVDDGRLDRQLLLAGLLGELALGGTDLLDLAVPRYRRPRGRGPSSRRGRPRRG
jgi:hypothetical protein